ncbi:MAG: tyrosine-type recombinase/integrase [Clostridiales Family XIII bacterium]|jgi:integrase|nr:tyrosine-type recombinase/integrase [Clostridiales Family XIII bacterium]
MNKIFDSKFADRIISFIRQKRILGFDYYDGTVVLKQFDNFCCNNFPDEMNLTEELCMSFFLTKTHKKHNSFRSDCSVLREFAKYLIQTGQNAFVMPITIVKRDVRMTPYIYTEDEIFKIWNVFDNIKIDKRHPVRHIVLPAVIRVLYCCGLRPVETRKLKVQHVDLNKGKFFIDNSKKHKDRIVMLADDVNEYLKKYNTIINCLLPDRTYFFPCSKLKCYSGKSLYLEFNKAKKILNLSLSNPYSPRIYDFRHTFATHRLYKWIHEKQDCTALLPYLGAYMGHANLNDTYYYISLVPEQFKIMSGFDFSKIESLLPDVTTNE